MINLFPIGCFPHHHRQRRATVWKFWKPKPEIEEIGGILNVYVMFFLPMQRAIGALSAATVKMTNGQKSNHRRSLHAQSLLDLNINLIADHFLFRPRMWKRTYTCIRTDTDGPPGNNSPYIARRSLLFAKVFIGFSIVSNRDERESCSDPEDTVYECTVQWVHSNPAAWFVYYINWQR